MKVPDLRGTLTPVFEPTSGSQLVRHVYDSITFRLRLGQAEIPDGLTAKLRTTLGQARELNEAIVESVENDERIVPNGGWVDRQMEREVAEWFFQYSLDEVGHFHATAYIEDAAGFQHWPCGGNLSITVQPHHIRFGNTIYCAFTRLFGATKTTACAAIPDLPDAAVQLEKAGWNITPPSGTLRDLKAELPHVFNSLRCKWLHLLPVNPPPTTPDTRMGRYGSPYATLDLTSIDPTLVEFDCEATGVDQFIELADETHRLGGYLMLDLVINHTGWGSYLQEHFPNYFRKSDEGKFESPGAWGTVWEDLVELGMEDSQLWIHLADAFLIWCRRGVDGFRCDAGYKVPMPVWRYIVAKVRLEFPDTVFLLEGLGGGWNETESLLTEGGMQWAYSELFQEFKPQQVSGYLDHVIKQGKRIGPLVHYSETHDNNRLAKRGREWSLMRNRLSALTSVNGTFGFTCGVEWLADQKIDVHGCAGLNWGAEEHIIEELATLNKLLNSHPCFAGGTTLTRLSSKDSPILAVLRLSVNGDELLALVNLDIEEPHSIELELPDRWTSATDLLGQAAGLADCQSIRLAKGAAICLQHTPPKSKMNPKAERLGQLLDQASDAENYPNIVRWTIADSTRIALVPYGHQLLFEHTAPFRVSAENTTMCDADYYTQNSQPVSDKHYAVLNFRASGTRYDIVFISFGETTKRTKATVQYLDKDLESNFIRHAYSTETHPLVGLLTNGIGGMLRMHERMGRITSKYDCVLAANLDDSVPVDRWVMAKRMRCWVKVNGFLFDLNSSLDGKLQAENRLVWVYEIPSRENQQFVDELHVIAEIRDGKNAVDFWFHFETEQPSVVAEITVRFDLEDRSFHGETHLDDSTVDHFRRATSHLENGVGFEFQPHPDRRLEARADCGEYYAEEEICRNIPHPIESSRGQTAQGDAYSPGWFTLPVSNTKMAHLAIVVNEPMLDVNERTATSFRSPENEIPPRLDYLCERMNTFIVRRGRGKTIIAGYPWFLDWGRDTLIAVRGLIANAQVETATSIIERFAAFEKGGTIPNAIFGDDDSNRETSDAPLWLAIAIEELADQTDETFYGQAIDGAGRTYRDVVLSIAKHYREGTANGIAMDPESMLIFSPVHFTWMDTNHPAGTKREGYPIEIQALWIRLLGQAGKLDPGERWQLMLGQAQESLAKFYWCENRSWLADCLLAKPGQSAAQAKVDGNLRCNLLIAVSLGVVDGHLAKRSVLAAIRHLVVPGAVRSLAPLPSAQPHPIEHNGQLLNDPASPYWGHYEGDEDTRRKPAYHNGTAWTWFLPQLCEAILRAWPNDDKATKAAKSYLSSSALLLKEGCAGQLPEILDGDAPHQQRGCDAQAWAMSELIRVLNQID